MNLAKPVIVFGGPYSNLQALTAMRATAASLNVDPDHVICTGDLVAYCAAPEQTVAAVVDWGIHVVAGNCDVQLGEAADDCGCGFEEGSTCDALAKDWYSFASSRVSHATRSLLSGLPSTLSFEMAGRSVNVVHGTKARNNQFVFASDTSVIEQELSTGDAALVVAGHCGIPFHASGDHGTWVNAGVIGMPANDGTPDGWYVVLEPSAQGISITSHRLAYDAATAAQDMRRHGYADAYADALESGLWPSLDVLPSPERAASGVPLETWQIDV